MVWDKIKEGGRIVGGTIAGGGVGGVLSSDKGREFLGDVGGWFSENLDRSDTGFREVDPRGRLGSAGNVAGQRADQAHESFVGTGEQMGQQAGRLEARARGEDSLAQEQLRQGLGQALAQQQSHAAGARPGNQAAAARGAAQQMGQQATGMAGQAAQAGIQERQAAEQGLAQVLGQQRGQDLSAAQGMTGQQLGALGQIEQLRGQRHAAGMGQPTPLEHGIGVAEGVGPALASALSDERAKTDAQEGDEAARGLLSALNPQRYRYRDEERHGEGERLGIMAQDLEQDPLGRALVQDTPEGKAIDVPGLTTALAGAVGHLGDRLDQIETDSRDHPQTRFAREKYSQRALEHPQTRLVREGDR